jgi:D-glycero-alpha-D-manno-heptose-7-phosphate kinase
MKEALLKGDFKSFAGCLRNGWFAKKNTAETVSNPFLDELYQYAMANGAEAAKISGAGGGGFMMIYCNPGNRMQLITALKKKDGIVLTPGFTEIGTQSWTIYNS